MSVEDLNRKLHMIKSGLDQRNIVPEQLESMSRVMGLLSVFNRGSTVTTNVEAVRNNLKKYTMLREEINRSLTNCINNNKI